MSAREFGEWQAFAQFHPIGDFKEDLHTAQLIAAFCSCLSGKNVAPATVLPDYETAFRERVKRSEKLDPEEFFNSMLGI